jgi:hypothetical protein
VKPWWDTATARSYGAKGIALILVAKRIAYVGAPIPANDRDHLPW